MPDLTFVPQACSTQLLVVNNYSYQDYFLFALPLWNPVGGAALGWAGPGAMTVNCNIPNEGAQQNIPCVPGVMNTLDLTLTFGNNDIQIMLLDPLTMLPLPGYPILYPAQPFGTVLNIQLFFIGPPAGNVIVQITSPGGPFPYPDMFMVNYAAISTQTTTQQQVCWDEDYRFGFNGMEKDNGAKGQGNSYDFGARVYDSRLGRFLSIDPKAKEFVFMSAYCYAANSPVSLIDASGENPQLPLHHEFLITVAIQIYDAAKTNGASGRGALLIMAQASLESGYGKSARDRGDYNLFGVMTCKTCSDYKVENKHGRIKDYSKAGGYEGAIKDYFEAKARKWPLSSELIKKETFTADDIDKSFYTGKYFEKEAVRNKTGHGSYNADNISADEETNNNKYGTELISQMGDFKKRLIASIDYQLAANQTEMTELKKSLQTTEDTGQAHLIQEQIAKLDAQNSKLSKVKADVSK